MCGRSTLCTDSEHRRSEEEREMRAGPGRAQGGAPPRQGGRCVPTTVSRVGRSAETSERTRKLCLLKPPRSSTRRGYRDYSGPRRPCTASATQKNDCSCGLPCAQGCAHRARMLETVGPRCAAGATQEMDCILIDGVNNKMNNDDSDSCLFFIPIHSRRVFNTLCSPLLGFVLLENN